MQPHLATPVVWGDCPEVPSDVHDHVFLAADVAGLSDFLEDLVCRDAVAFCRALRVVKLARVVTLAPIIAGVTLYMRRTQSLTETSRPPLVPLFVVGFIVAMLLRSTGFLPDSILAAAQMMQTLLLASAMFALGLGVHLRGLIRSGGKSLLLGLLSTLVILAISLVGTILFPPT